MGPISFGNKAKRMGVVDANKILNFRWVSLSLD